jgi:glycosyltransferase involved in cell wall biosynthesis
MARDPSHVVMIGTSFQTRGGIASVLQTYRAAGLFDRWPVDFVATHRDGSKLEKFVKAIHAFAAFFSLLLRHRSAVLHVHSASRASFWRKSLFMAFAMAARWPVIFHLHGGGFATFYDAECGPVRRALVRFFLDRAACIVVVSERWCAWMNRVTSNPRVVSIANPVALPDPTDIARVPQLVAFTGKLCEQKGIFELLQAAVGLRREFPNLRVECAGDGDLEEVERCVASMGLASNVRLHGWIGRRRRGELLARASVFVLPSHAEGLPVSLLEAMAAGCAVVATSVGGIPDVVDDGFNGLLVPPGEPQALERTLARLLADPQLAREMGRAARATIANRFTPERTVAQVEELYSELGVGRDMPAPRPRVSRQLKEIS